MRKKKLLLLAIAAVLCVLWLVWLFKREPMFHGKPESVWLNELKYNDESQVPQWKSFGPDGIRILSHGLNRGLGPVERAYEHLWYRTPVPLRGFFKKPEDLSSSRMCAASMLSYLGTNTMPALPALKRSLQNETRASARGIVVGCFESLLPVMDEKQKRDFLPYFLRGMNSDDESERNNSTAALGCYPGNAEVTHALTNALNDSVPHIRLLAAESLNRVDSTAADKAGVVSVLVALLKKPDPLLQSDMMAATALGKIGPTRPELAVPALIEATHSKDQNLAGSAIYALAHFKAESATIVPALTNLCYGSNDLCRGIARHVLKQMDPKTAKTIGIK